MASTAEVLINAVLKYAGFTRQQFDEGASHVKSEFESFRARAIASELALAEMGRDLRRIREHLGIGPDVGAEGGEAARLGAPQVPQPDSNPPAGGDAAPL